MSDHTGAGPGRYPDAPVGPSQDFDQPLPPGQQLPPGQPAPAAADPVTAPSSAAGPLPAVGVDSKGRPRHTRVSGVWVALIVATVLLILLIVFIAQNQQKVAIHFLGWSGHLSVALVILLSGACGVLLAAIPGTIRIMQLRKAVRQNATRLPV